MIKVRLNESRMDERGAESATPTRVLCVRGINGSCPIFNKTSRFAKYKHADLKMPHNF